MGEDSALSSGHLTPVRSQEDDQEDTAGVQDDLQEDVDEDCEGHDQCKSKNEHLRKLSITSDVKSQLVDIYDHANGLNIDEQILELAQKEKEKLVMMEQEEQR